MRRIARGGMGEIYLARTRGTAGFEKSCVIKTILPHLAEQSEFLTKFLDEGRIVVQLIHGNIVPVFDMGDEDGEVYIAMEYIPGRDLREVGKKLSATGQMMPVDLALFVVGEVCKGLDYAHRKTGEDGKPLGIIHRDVSPSNILISREGEVKIIDFGIARAAGRLGETASGRIQGKFCYMSPEQASGKPLDPRSDIFSAALVLYELLTGFRPFEGDSDLESLELVRNCELDPPSTLNPNVPDEVDEIVMGALAASPKDRPESIDRFQIALLQYLYSTGSSPTPTDVARFLRELFPEGLEREELRSSREAAKASPPKKKMSLDEALDFELGLLQGGTGTADIDPHETTAISSEESRPTPATVDDPSAQPPTEPTPVPTPVPTAEQTPVAKNKTPMWLMGGLATVVIAIIASVVATSRNDGAAATPTVAPEIEEKPVGKIQTFKLLAEPKDAGAQFFVNGGKLSAPVVRVAEGELVDVTAKAEGCEAVTKQLEYGAGNTTSVFTLKCTPPSAPPTQDVGPDVDATAIAAVETVPDRRGPRVRPKPPPKPTPEPQPAAAQGCIMMSIINPLVATWYVDGTVVHSGRGGVKNHRVAAGARVIRVVNKGVKLDHERTVRVPAGDDCLKVILDGNNLK